MTKLLFQLVKLAAHFGVHRPELQLREQDSGVYYPEYKLITLPIDEDTHGKERSNETRLVHEFTHHLVHCVGVSAQDIHGPEFCACLMEVARFWYGDVSAYPWHTDFPQVEEYYNAHKPVQKPEAMQWHPLIEVSKLRWLRQS